MENKAHFVRLICPCEVQYGIIESQYKGVSFLLPEAKVEDNENDIT